VLSGRYTTSVSEMLVDYMKPQSCGGREQLRELTLSGGGKTLKVETEGDVAFSALPYSDKQLMDAQHIWQLPATEGTTLHLDARVRGIGNASCGRDVDTLPQYRIPQSKQTFRLRLSAK